MAINVARFEHQGRIQWGVLQNERIIPIPGDYPTTRDFVLAKSVEDLAPAARRRSLHVRGRDSVAGHPQPAIKSGEDRNFAGSRRHDHRL